MPSRYIIHLPNLRNLTFLKMDYTEFRREFFPKILLLDWMFAIKQWGMSDPLTLLQLLIEMECCGATLIARFMGPIWGRQTQVGPMLAPWTLLSGYYGSFSSQAPILTTITACQPNKYKVIYRAVIFFKQSYYSHSAFAFIVMNLKGVWWIFIGCWRHAIHFAW